MPVLRSSYQRLATCTENLTAERIEVTAEVCYCLDLEPVPEGEMPPGPLAIKSQATQVGPNPLPNVGSVYQFGNEFDFNLFALNRGPVQYNRNNCNKATVCVTYGPFPQGTNDLTEDPTQIEKTVEIDFIEESRPGTDFVYQGACDGNGRLIVEIDEDGEEVTDSEGNLIQLQPLVITPGDIGPIRNSAGCPARRNCLEYRHVLTIRNYVERWDCRLTSPAGPLGKWNSRPTRIVEQDDFGILFDCTYAACTLQLLDVGKTNVNFSGRTYLCLDWVLSYDPDGYFIKHLDAGTQAALVAGSKDPMIRDSSGNPGGIIADNDERLERNKTGKRDLGVTEPILLNGEGVESCIDNSLGFPAPIYLAYTKQNSKFNFDLLPICG